MDLVKINKCTEAELSAKEISNGTIYFITDGDVPRIYMDTDNTRIKFGVIVDTSLSASSDNAISNKTVNTSINSLKNSINQKAPKTVATQTANGLMSSTDKTKLDNLSYNFGSGTLAKGATSITITGLNATSDSIIDVYIKDKVGIAPTSVQVTSGNVVLTFDAQSEAIEVGVRCS